ncbi:helix-turn-helix transcriptional regulator [Candidatus Liberibacter africanus]|uniref:Transcriptional regulator protein n=1 Tax=Candidatus Liberibacter africanus PTSAPSY TaxID=1277257 RepID=A0A0G3I8Z2_LIBAF|nr:helix-turn-helix domain-containing protein [Candidatus Liberibacter africanus]AKK20232.1 transcriptional regulator protein [Candidatus Liberibacter africanus PTSAPSY]QTP64007.1 helix-turn-helix transcriptional regulator [Candidatus Liberibacter africanus]
MIGNKKHPNPVDISVGKRIRLRRMVLGMSQGKLGDSLGITFQQVQKYEKGVNRVCASRLLHISEVLKSPVTFFLGIESKTNSDTQSEENDVMDFIFSSDGLQLNRYFVKISDTKVRQKIIELVKSMVSSENECEHMTE